ncbi:hypothetical protein ACFE04_024552 [Oxalis oulophora]
MNPVVELEDQISTTDDNDEIIHPDSSSSQECDSGVIDKLHDFTNSGMMPVEEGNMEFQTVKQMFLPGLGPYANNTDVVAVHKAQKSASSTLKARWDSFRIFSDAVAKNRGGNDNIRFAWYGGSKDEIRRIVSHGFSFKPASSVIYAGGITLFSSMRSLYGMESAKFDEDGVRHMLLCRVILGNSEIVLPGSNQYYPSSDKFDSGVDSLTDPSRYIIWTPFVNSHVFPHYVVSFKASSFMAPSRNPQTFSFKQGPCRTTAPVMRLPASPWISFPDLLAKISKYLNPTKIALVSKHYGEFRANKISRVQLIRVLRQVIGDRLLIGIIKAHKEKVGMRT